MTKTKLVYKVMNSEGKYHAGGGYGYFDEVGITFATRKGAVTCITNQSMITNTPDRRLNNPALTWKVVEFELVETNSNVVDAQKVVEATYRRYDLRVKYGAKFGDFVDNLFDDNNETEFKYVLRFNQIPLEIKPTLYAEIKQSLKAGNIPIRSTRKTEYWSGMLMAFKTRNHAMLVKLGTSINSVDFIDLTTLEEIKSV